MIKKLFSALGVGAAPPAAHSAPPYEPYEGKAAKGLYNLLFCDDLSLFRKSATEKAGSIWAMVLGDPPDVAALQKIAGDKSAESRLRVLAFNKLRTAGVRVPTKILLGIIIEVPLKDGLDVLAAYQDGSVRYLNQSGKVAIFEGGVEEVETLAGDLLRASQGLVERIGPWEKPRLPPPKPGNARMTFLVSDGLYFGEGPLDALQRDALGGPVLAKATELLRSVGEVGRR